MPPFALVPARLVCTGQVLAPDGAALVRLLLLAPLLEEWVLRAGVQAWLIERGGPGSPGGWLAPVALSTALFGLLHARAGAAAAIGVIGPGLLMALLYQHGRDWRWCALLHCGLNALALAACNF